jgi:hypothetical protein
MMKAITRKQVCQGAPERYAKQYPPGRDYSIHRSDPEEVREALLALEPQERTPERIAEIVGNGTWTVLECDECGASVDWVCHFGGDHYDGPSAIVCIDCLTDAVKLHNAQPNPAEC